MKIFRHRVACARFCIMFLCTWFQCNTFTYAETLSVPLGFDSFDSMSSRGRPLYESRIKIGIGGVAVYPRAPSLASPWPRPASPPSAFTSFTLYQVPQQQFVHDSDIYGWTQLGAQLSKPHSRISYKDLFEVKYEYFIVGIYRENVIGLGPMIEFTLDQKYKLWAIVPTVRKNADANTNLIIGISKEF